MSLPSNLTIRRTGGLHHNEVVQLNNAFDYVLGLVGNPSGSSDSQESDPIFTTSPAYNITESDIDNWDEAYSWGDHASAGYLTSFTETDPVFTASAAAGIGAGDITNWNTAFGWGDHAVAGYQSQDAFLDDIAALTDPGGDRSLIWDDTANEITWASYPGSVLLAGNIVALDGDNALPGNNKHYATNGSGTKGWIDIRGATNSITLSGSNFQLVNDAASPAAGHYYGTDGAAAKGWHPNPINTVNKSSAQTVSSTSYTNITSTNAFASSQNIRIRATLWLRFPTSGTSGTFLLQPNWSFNAPTLNLIGADSLGDQFTIALNNTSTEITVTVASTGAANLICPMQVELYGETASVTQFVMQIRKGTITNNFEVYRAVMDVSLF